MTVAKERTPASLLRDVTAGSELAGLSREGGYKTAGKAEEKDKIIMIKEKKVKKKMMIMIKEM